MGNREFKGGGPEGELHFSEEELADMKRELELRAQGGNTRARRSGKLHLRSDMEIGLDDTRPARVVTRATGTIPLTLLPKRPPADTETSEGVPPVESAPAPEPPAPTPPTPTAPAPPSPVPEPLPPSERPPSEPQAPDPFEPSPDLSKTMLGFGPEVVPTAPSPPPEPLGTPEPQAEEPAPPEEAAPPSPAPAEAPEPSKPEEPEQAAKAEADGGLGQQIMPVATPAPGVADDLASGLGDPEDAPTTPAMSVGVLFGSPASAPRDDLFDTDPGEKTLKADDRDPIERLVSSEIILDVDEPEQEPEEPPRRELSPDEIEPEDIETASGDPNEMPPSVDEIDPEDLPTMLMLSEQPESRELVKGILADMPAGLPDADEDDTLELSPEAVQHALATAQKAAQSGAEAPAPADEPPAEELPFVEHPAEELPFVEPPAEELPFVEPPAEELPFVEPPAEELPLVEPEEPAAEEPPPPAPEAEVEDEDDEGAAEDAPSPPEGEEEDLDAPEGGDDDGIADWAAEDEPTELAVPRFEDVEEQAEEEETTPDEEEEAAPDAEEKAAPVEEDEASLADTIPPVEPEEMESGEVALEADDLEEMDSDAGVDPTTITLDEEAPPLPEDDDEDEDEDEDEEAPRPAIFEPEEDLSMPALPAMADAHPPEVEVTQRTDPPDPPLFDDGDVPDAVAEASPDAEELPEVAEDEVEEINPEEVGLTEVDEDEVEELSPDEIGLEEVNTPLPTLSPFDKVNEPADMLKIPAGKEPDDDIMTSAPVIDTPPPAPPKQEAPAEKARPTARQPQVGQRKRPWYADIFDEDWYRISPLPPPGQVKREILFLEESLNPTPESQVLELGCGAGQHVIELARKGYRITGFDMSLQLLIQAGELAQREGLMVDFLQGDFKDIGIEERFDAVYCLGSRFGYFNDKNNAKVIESVNRSLKKGGRFLLDVTNRDYCLRDLPARVWREGAGCLVLEEVEFEYFTSRIISKRTVVFEDGRHMEQEISVRVYSLHEVGNLLHQAGFRVLQVSGNLAHPGVFFGNHSRSLLFLAEKKR